MHTSPNDTPIISLIIKKSTKSHYFTYILNNLPVKTKEVTFFVSFKEISKHIFAIKKATDRFWITLAVAFFAEKTLPFSKTDSFGTACRKAARVRSDDREYSS